MSVSAGDIQPLCFVSIHAVLLNSVASGGDMTHQQQFTARQYCHKTLVACTVGMRVQVGVAYMHNALSRCVALVLSMTYPCNLLLYQLVGDSADTEEYVSCLI